MFLIVGLGNPGKQYENTRHNVGFDAIDCLVDEYRIPSSGKQHKAMFGKGIIEGQKVILAKPMTYMNLSGEAVRALVDYYKIDPETELLVIFDDISLAPGNIRIRKKGSAGGHNGLKNIESCMMTANYARIKFGIGNDFPKGAQIDFVLGTFSDEENKLIEEKLDYVGEMIKSFCLQGLDRTMNQFNKK